MRCNKIWLLIGAVLVQLSLLFELNLIEFRRRIIPLEIDYIHVFKKMFLRMNHEVEILWIEFQGEERLNNWTRIKFPFKQFESDAYVLFHSLNVKLFVSTQFFIWILGKKCIFRCKLKNVAWNMVGSEYEGNEQPIWIIKIPMNYNRWDKIDFFKYWLDFYGS